LGYWRKWDLCKKYTHFYFAKKMEWRKKLQNFKFLYFTFRRNNGYFFLNKRHLHFRIVKCSAFEYWSIGNLEKNDISKRREIRLHIQRIPQRRSLINGHLCLKTFSGDCVQPRQYNPDLELPELQMRVGQKVSVERRRSLKSATPVECGFPPARLLHCGRLHRQVEVLSSLAHWVKDLQRN
jgi:hypothetical protein